MGISIISFKNSTQGIVLSIVLKRLTRQSKSATYRVRSINGRSLTLSHTCTYTFTLNKSTECADVIDHLLEILPTFILVH